MELHVELHVDVPSAKLVFHFSSVEYIMLVFKILILESRPIVKLTLPISTSTSIVSAVAHLSKAKNILGSNFKRPFFFHHPVGKQ